MKGRIDAGVDHPVVVVFDLWCLGTRRVDRFGGDELMVVGEAQMLTRA